MKRLFIIHGWDGYPEEGWFPWLKKEMESRGFEVTVPQMPDAEFPKIEKWIPALSSAVGTADNNTFFVGHSMGCQAIARYLETLPEDVTVGGAVFVAGFFKRLRSLGKDAEVIAISKHWLESPIDFKKIKQHLPKSVAIFSDNDPFVPIDNTEEFEQNLGSQIIIEQNYGHFSGGDDRVTKLPIVLDSLDKLAQ